MIHSVELDRFQLVGSKNNLNCYDHVSLNADDQPVLCKSKVCRTLQNNVSKHCLPQDKYMVSVFGLSSKKIRDQMAE